LKQLIAFKDIENARKVLGLFDDISINSIKQKHRMLIQKYHPDKHHNSNDKSTYEEKVKNL